MEGEAMVAIIQGLRDAGLKVTLMSGASLQNCQKPRRRVSETRSSVQTSTESPKRVASAQITDTHYASSYQLAHCRLKPFPSPYLSELSVQGQAANKTKGISRQVRSFGCGESSSAEFRRYKRTRGSFYHSPSNCLPAESPTDSFVHSLRKYPLPTGRSASTELVQRLLNYTQTKHLSRNNSLSLRSLNQRPRRSSKQKTSAHSNKHKNIQTYTRTVNEEPEEVVKKSRKRFKYDQLSETYNYLKASHSGSRNYTGKNNEVRYLNDVKRYLREKIRQLVNQQTPISCPKVQSRYDDHRRLFHKQTNSATNPIPSENEMNTEPVKADMPTSTQIRRYNRCMGTTPSIGICPKTLNRYRGHRRLRHGDDILKETVETQVEDPVFCRPPAGTRLPGPSFSPIRPCTFAKDTAISALLSSKDIENEVLKWVTLLPTFINNTPENKRLHIERAHGLIDKLNMWKDKPDFYKKALKAINDLLDSLPGLPTLGFDDESLNDKLREIIKTWQEDIDPDLRTKIGNLMHKDQLLDQFVDRLKPIIIRNESKEQFKKETKTIIDETSEKQSDDDVQNEINDQVEDLAQQLYNFSQNMAKKRRKGKFYKQPVTNWLQNIDDVSYDVKKQVQPLAEKADYKLNQLINENATDDNLADEINNFFDSIPYEYFPLTSEEKDQLIENFINDLKSVSFNSLTPKTKQELADKLFKILKIKPKGAITKNSFDDYYDTISDKTILSPEGRIEPSRDISSNIMSKPTTSRKQQAFDWENDPNIPKDIKENLLNDFDKMLQELRLNNAGDDVIQKAIEDFMRSLPDKGLTLSTSQQNRLFAKLVDQGKSKPSKGRNWLEDSPYEEMKNKNIFEDFEKKLQRLQSQGVSDDIIQKEINDFFKSLANKGIQLTPSEQDELAKDLCRKTKSKPSTSGQPVMDWLEDVPDLSKEVKQKNKSFINSQKFKQLQSEGDDDDDVNEEINRFLESTPRKGILNTTPKQFSRNKRSADWIEDEPSSSDEIEINGQGAAKNFDNKLPQLKSQGVGDDVIQDEIYNLIRSLSSKRLKLTEPTEDKLRKDVFHQIKSYPTTSIQPVMDWFEKEPNISEDVKIKNKRYIKNFDKKLQQMRSADVSDDAIQEEIDDFLNSLPNKGVNIPQSKQDQLAKVFFSRSKPNPVTNNQPATGWLENAPNISEETKQKNERFVKKFDKKLQQLKSDDDDVIQEEIDDFLNSLTARGIKLTQSKEDQLAKDLLSQTTKISEQNRFASNQPAADWLENAPDISEETKNEAKSFVNKFDERLQQLKSGGVSDDVIQDEINDFVRLLPQQGISFTPSRQKELAKDLFRQTKFKPIPEHFTSNQPAANWLENASYISEGTKNNTKGYVKNFDKRLQQLRSDGVSENAIQDEINDFVSSLPQKGILLTPSRQKELAKDFFRQTKPKQMQKQLSRNRPAADWLENAPRISEDVKTKNKNFFHDFDKRLEELQSQGASDLVIQEEIDDFLDSLPNQGIALTPSKQQQLAKNLFGQTIPGQKRFVRNQPAMDWLDNVPNISEETKNKNKNNVKHFDKKLEELKSQGASDDVIQEEINDFISSLPKKGIKVTQSDKDELANDLFQQSDSKLEQKQHARNQPIVDWFENTPYVSEDVKRKNKHFVKDFDKKLEELKSQGASDDAVQEEIDYFIHSLPKRSIKLTQSIQDQLARDIFSRTQSKPVQKQLINNKPAEYWLENTPNVPEDVKRNNKSSVKDFDKKLQEMKFQGVSDNVIKKEIDDFLNSLPNRGINLTQSKQDELAKNLFRQAKFLPHQKQFTSKQPAIDWLESAPNVPEDVKRKNRSSVKNFDKKLQELKSEGASDDVIQDEINNFLDSLPNTGIKLTHSKQEQLAKDLFTQTKTKPIQKQFTNFQSAEDWLESTPNISEETKNKNKTFARNFDKRLQDLQSQGASDDIIQEEIDDFLEALPNRGIRITQSKHNELAKELFKRSKSIPEQNQFARNRPVSNWLEDAPNIPEETKTNSKIFVKNIDKRLQDLQSQGASDDVIQEDIGKFLETLPNRGITITESKQKELAKDFFKKSKSVPEQNQFANFDKRLRDLQSQGANDDFIQEEIDNFLAALPDRGIKITQSKQNELAKELFKKSKSTPEQKQFARDQPAADWLQNAPNITEDVKRKNKGFVKNFDKRLQELRSEDASDDVIQDEINDFLSSLPNKGIKLSKQEQLAKDLFSQTRLKPIQDESKYKSEQKQIEKNQPTADWLENATFISEETKNKTKNFAKNFDKRLQDLQSQGASDDVIQEEIGDFLKAMVNKGIMLTQSKKDQLAKELFSQTRSKPSTRNLPVTDWLENDPNISDETKNKNIHFVKKFDKKLQTLKSEDASDGVIQEEIDNFLNSLPNKGIKLTQSNQEKLAKNLFQKTKSIPIQKKISSSNQPAADWLENAPNVPEDVKRKNKNFVNNFDKRLQELKSQGLSDDIIQEEIVDFLESLPHKGINLTPSKQNELSRDLVKESPNQKQFARNQTVAKWLENAPNVPEDVKRKNRNYVKIFDKKIENLRNQGVSDDVIQEEIDDFLESLPNKGINLTQSKQNELSRDLLKQPKSKLEQKQFAKNQPAANWLENAPNVPEDVKRKNRDYVKHFDKRLEELKNQGLSDDIIQEEIDDFLESLPNKGINLTQSKQNELSRDLFNDSPKQKQFARNQPAATWLDNAFNVPEVVKRKNKGYVTNFDKRLQELKSQGASDDVIQEEIGDFLDALPNKGINLSQSKQDQLAKDLYSQTKSKPSTSSQPVTDWLENSSNISEETKKKNKNSMKNFHNKLQQLKSEGADEDVIQEKIEDFVSSLPRKGISITPSQQNQLAKDIQNNLKYIPDNRNSSRPGSNWLTNARNIPMHIKDNNRNFFKDFDKKLEKLKSQHADSDEIEKEINKVIQSLPKKGILLTPTQQSQLSKDLSQSKLKPNRGDTQQKLDWLKNTANISEGSKNKETILFDDFDKKIQKLKANHSSGDVIKAESKRFLSSLSDRGLKMTPLEKAQVTEKIASGYKSSSPDRNHQRKRWDQSEQTHKDISDTVANLLNSGPTNISDVKRNEIAQKLMDLLANNNSLSNSEIQAEIEKILNKEASSSDHDLTDDSGEFIIAVKEMPSQVADTSHWSSLNEPNIQKQVKKIHGIPYSVERNIKDALANQIARGMSDKETQQLIKAMLREANVPEDEARRIIDELMRKNKEMSGGNRPLKETKPDFLRLLAENKRLQELQDIIQSWIFDTLLNLDDEIFIENMAEDLAGNVLEMENNVQQNKTPRTEQKEIESLRSQIFEWLDKFVDSDDFPKSSDIEALINEIRGTSSGRYYPSQRDDSSSINDLVDKWVNTLPLSRMDSSEEMEFEELKEKLKDNILNVGLKFESDLRNKIKNFLENSPLELKNIKDKKDVLKELEDQLIDILKGTRVRGKLPAFSTEIGKKKATDDLLDAIGKWVKNLPIQSNTPEEKAEAKKIKQQVESKLIHKIGELNMNPQILNDDFIYEDMLGDEVDSLLSNIQSENVHRNQKELKNKLLDIVRKARQKIREENEGQIYKQQLRDAITRTMPSLDLSEDGKAAFEVLKDVIADTFINMHYVGNDPQEINKLIKKISDEIHTFYNNYLKRCPAVSVDTSKLNEGIYNALEAIPEPRNEAFKDEIELVKIKDQIADWAKTLPLKTQTGQEMLKLYKMISVLAKKLHDLENKRETIPAREYEDKFIKEVMVFINKLTLDIDQGEDINKFADTLLQNLKDTSEARRLNSSNRHSIRSEDCSCYVPTMPPCTLSKEDQDHLERIRNRTPVIKGNISFNKVSCNPCPVDAGSQTEVNSLPHDFCPIRGLALCQRNSFAQTPCRNTQAVGSQINESTNTFECRWDSNRDNCTEPAKISSSYPNPCLSSTAIPQRPVSPLSRSPCNPRPKSCITNRPSTHSQNNFFDSRHPTYSRPQYQSYRPVPCRPEELSQIRARIHCSAPAPYQISDQSNSSQRQTRPYLYRLPRASRPHSPYPCDTPTDPSSEQDPQRRKYQPGQYYSQSQACPQYEPPRQRMVPGTSTPYNPCPGPASQYQLRTQRPQQVNQPRSCASASHSPIHFQGQSCLTPQSSVPFSSSQQLPRSRSPGPSRIKVEPISSEDYEAGPSCSFQKRVTHLGSFDHMKPHDWDKRRVNHFWGGNRSILSEEECHEFNRCKCNPKCGKYSGRRRPCHLHNDQSMNNCSKCCGIHCPYPSCLYFR